MTVSIAHRPITSAAALSLSARRVLQLIELGTEWLQWTMQAVDAPHDFADESALLDQIQQDLHGRALVQLPATGLLAGPAKLLSLGPQDLQVLMAAEAGDDSLHHQLRDVLNRHALLTHADFAAVSAWLKDLDVARAPVFQSIDLAALTALYRLAVQPALDESGASTTREAAVFALQYAVSPVEFADYLRFYLALATRPGHGATAPEQRYAQAQSGAAALAPCLFGALGGRAGPTGLAGLASPAQVGAALSAWRQQGRTLGFARLSLGLAEMAQHGHYAGQTGAAAQAQVNAYLQPAQGFLANHLPNRFLVGQDGASCLYTAQGDGQQATLALSPQGVLTLQSFGPSA